MARQYITSLVDPFNTRMAQPKLLDGATRRSSGLRFRSTGNITLEGQGLDNYMVLFPCFSQGVSWRRINDIDYTYATPYPNHMLAGTDRNNVKMCRLVSSGLKLSLMNNADDNEGYWEAIRIPLDSIEWGDSAAPVFEDGVVHLPSGTTFPNMANYYSFQTGLLRDLDRFLFKLNSTQADHPFVNVSLETNVNYASGIATNGLLDRNFDVIVIRLVGRINTTTPSVIKYEHMSNQEVIYKQDTLMARLATNSPMVGNMPMLLERTSFETPAIQIS
jgi:hypothetical protein